MEIVGVVSDAKFATPRDTALTVYCPYRQIIGLMRSMCVELRTTGKPTAIAGRVRKELQELDSNLPVLKIDTVEQLNDVLVQERFMAALAGFFGGVAVLLACLGLYGVISFTVARRTSEIGIRLALGATPGNVLRMVFKESLLLVLVGIAIGFGATLVLMRLISTHLFGVSTADPLTFIAATLLLLAVAALAAFVPARRAAGVDPLVALRYE